MSWSFAGNAKEYLPVDTAANKISKLGLVAAKLDWF